jgi:RNA polymerase sigma-70 factor (ECF subfamily)
MLTTPPSLLERLRRTPEGEAWGKFVDMYTPLLFAWTRRLGLDVHDAADLVQDLFAVLVERLPSFQYDEGRSFRAWLKTILLNRWRNWQRKRATERRAEPFDPDALAKESDLPELEEAEYRERLVHRALELLQTEFQPVTWKACWEFVVCDRPAAEVAAELGITPNAVYLAKSRVLRRLREELHGLLE